MASSNVVGRRECSVNRRETDHKQNQTNFFFFFSNENSRNARVPISMIPISVYAWRECVLLTFRCPSPFSFNGKLNYEYVENGERKKKKLIAVHQLLLT